MSDSIFPERPVIFSPSLAATIGLESAILLQHLQQLNQLSIQISEANLSAEFRWTSISLGELSLHLPFWSPAAIRRTLQNLQDLGMLLLNAFPEHSNTPFIYAINQKQNTAANTINKTQPPAPESTSQTSTESLGAHRLPDNWRPSYAVVSKLGDAGIPPNYTQDCIEEFCLYWKERNEASHAWSSKFFQHVTRRWQQEQQKQAEQSKPKLQAPLQNINQWHPHKDAIEILERMGIHQNFIDDAVPEFILYWRERGEPQNTWNSKFVNHVKNQWARYTNTLKYDTEPRQITANWQPDSDVFDVLSIANIDLNFARMLIPEFVLYWKDRQEAHHSWNTKFLQYVKKAWSQRCTPTENKKTRERSLQEDLTDRSWAH